MMMHQVLTATGIALAGLFSGASAGTCPVHEIYIIEDSGFFNAPGVTAGRMARFCSDDPAHVELLGEAGGRLGPLGWGGISFRPGTDDLYGFENTTNSLRRLDENGGNTLIDSVGYMSSGIAGLGFSNDGAIAYAAGNMSFWGRIVQADAETGQVISMHSFPNVSIGSVAVVPEGTTLPYEPGTLLAINTIGSAPGVQLIVLDLKTNTSSLVGSISGIGFNAAFETGLDFAPDGTLYAAIQGFTGGGGDVSTHLFILDPVTAAADLIGVIDAQGTWDASSIAVRPAPAGPLGDLNGDGAVDVADLLLLLGAWGPCDGSACNGDLNNDGAVDVSDLLMLLGNWG